MKKSKFKLTDTPYDDFIKLKSQSKLFVILIEFINCLKKNAPEDNYELVNNLARKIGQFSISIWMFQNNRLSYTLLSQEWAIIEQLYELLEFKHNLVVKKWLSLNATINDLVL